MKGVLFTILQHVVEDGYGPDAWDEVLDAAGVDGAYTSLGNYPDGELTRIVVQLSARLGITVPEALILGGRLGSVALFERHADLIAEMSSWRDVLLGLDDIIHPEVRKLYPGAEVPSFDVVETDGTLVVTYRSSRRLCRLAEGLVLGLGDRWETALSVWHRSCVLEGDDECVMEIVET